MFEEKTIPFVTKGPDYTFILNCSGASRIMKVINFASNETRNFHLVPLSGTKSIQESSIMLNRSRYCPKMFRFRSPPIWTSIFITQKDLSIFALWNQTYTLASIGAPMFYIRCQTAPSLWTLGSDQPVIPRVAFIR